MNIQYREQHTVQYSIVEWSDFEEKEGTNLKKKFFSLFEEKLPKKLFYYFLDQKLKLIKF